MLDCSRRELLDRHFNFICKTLESDYDFKRASGITTSLIINQLLKLQLADSLRPVVDNHYAPQLKPIHIVVHNEGCCKEFIEQAKTIVDILKLKDSLLEHLKFISINSSEFEMLEADRDIIIFDNSLVV